MWTQAQILMIAQQVLSLNPSRVIFAKQKKGHVCSSLQCLWVELESSRMLVSMVCNFSDYRPRFSEQTRIWDHCDGTGWRIYSRWLTLTYWHVTEKQICHSRAEIIVTWEQMKALPILWQWWRNDDLWMAAIGTWVLTLLKKRLQARWGCFSPMLFWHASFLSLWFIFLVPCPEMLGWAVWMSFQS